jgi:poly(hydroxyalkanoate) depolymerase family esterase
LNMRRLGSVVSVLTAAKRAMNAEIAHEDARLGVMEGFGSNPGELVARIYLPDGLRERAPLVVVLHGCTQSASFYDKGSGWSELACRHGFALLFPEQRRTNNANLCFNWFEPADARRGRGEALSISQMIQHMISRHDLDPSRVFVTGLSAGGAMAAAMLATYPELFAGGAIIAGLPFASANNVAEALERMRGHGAPSRQDLAARLQAAAPLGGAKPTLSVWHGTRDTIVDPVNARAIVDQWRDLHGLGTTPGAVEAIDGHRREVWRDAAGRDIVEEYMVQGMGHGTPLDTLGAENCGTPGPHMLEANICSTSRIARFWGLTDEAIARQERSGSEASRPTAPVVRGPSTLPTIPAVPGIEAVIGNALRAANLMR